MWIKFGNKTLKIKMASLWMSVMMLGGIAASPDAWAVRVKDVAQFEGVRSNSLIGYGLVVGLDGTGDQTTQSPFTTQAMNAMLAQMGVNLPPGAQVQTKNIAAVIVTGELQAFMRPGEPIDVTVSSMGNAKSLKGGTLLMTQLKGPDGATYALAQGNVLVGTASGRGPAPQQNAGRIPAGAKIERAAPLPEGHGAALMLSVPDFTMAQKIETAINAKLGPIARAVDARRIVIGSSATQALPMVAIASQVENLEIDAAPVAAKVVINARTGSLVMGQAVTVGECSIAQGNLTVSVGEGQQNQSGTANGGAIARVPPKSSLAEVVKVLNAMGATPQDLIAILQAMKSAGALQAEIEVI